MTQEAMKQSPEESYEGGVVHSVLQWHVDAVPTPQALPNVCQIPRAGEKVIPVFVEGDRHDPAGKQETGESCALGSPLHPTSRSTFSAPAKPSYSVPTPFLDPVSTSTTLSNRPSQPTHPTLLNEQPPPMP